MSKWITLERKVRHKVAIAGQVSDNETGKTISNAIVEITQMPEAFKMKRSLQALQYGSDWETLLKRCDRTTTANDGFFYFTDLPPGAYTLTAALPGAATRYKIAQTTAIIPNEGKLVSANIALLPSGIKGKVMDWQEVAIARAKVQIVGSGEFTFTDDNGNYQIVGLEAPKQEGSKRKITVVVSAKDYQQISKNPELSLGEVVTVNCNLRLTKSNSSAVPKNQPN
jgi:hypothetical protein